MPIIFLVLERGGLFWKGAGGSANFNFYGCGDFCDQKINPQEIVCVSIFLEGGVRSQILSQDPVVILPN